MQIKEVLIIFIFFALSTGIKAQQSNVTILRGKISDENGELLIGATIVMTSDKSHGTITDLDGNYSLKILGLGEKSVTISYIGYKPLEEVIHVAAGQKIILKDFILKSASVAMKETVITAKAVKTADSYMQNIKSKSSVSIDFISSATIKRTGDATVSAAVARVAGVSTVGSFITVRGIGDRYILTTINGLQIPTLDPFTNNIKLDLFPASLVDNIVISKTLSPELPSDWSGAYLSVETKDFPEKLAINIESSVEYNPQTSFKDIVSSEQSSTDWLGFDNNFRDHNHKSFIPVIPNPTTYQQFVALGLGSYYKSIGVNETTYWNDTYYKLGLIQLGLLAPALINDPLAVQQAKDTYLKGDYQNTAFNIINAGGAKSGQTFPNNWTTIKRSAPLNISQSLSIGNQINIKNTVIGFIAGFRYGSSVQSDADAQMNRSTTDSSGIIMKINGVKQAISRETFSWSALLCASLKINKNNSFSFLFMPNFSGINNAKSGTDTIDAFDKGNKLESQFYEHRQQIIYQFKSEHYFPSLKLKINLNASTTRGNSMVPDFKDLVYTIYPGGNGTILAAHRYYRYLLENLTDYHIFAEFPLQNHPGFIRKIKTGASYQDMFRKFDQYDYSIGFGEGYSASFTNTSIAEFFDLDNFKLGSYNYNGKEYSTVNMYYKESDLPSNHTIGKRNLAAAFIMLDYDLSSRLRFAGGTRFEHFFEFTDAALFDSLKLSPDDERRNVMGEAFIIQPSKISTSDLIPSCGLIYKLKKEENLPINLRLNFGKSILRPSIRESYDGIMYDYELRANVFGNSLLKPTSVNNYDLRVETYFKSGDNISVSLFVKDFKNHIELISLGSGFSWMNVNKSIVRGLEIEGRKIISKNIEFRANFSWIYSRTSFVQYQFQITNLIKTYIPKDTLSRTMYGQAPYVANAMLSYSSDSLGFVASLNYNIQGPRLVIASADNKSDVYELPRHLLDFKLSQKMSKHFSISFSIRDILNSPVRRAYNYPGPEKWTINYDLYHFGSSYKVGFLYRF